MRKPWAEILKGNCIITQVKATWESNHRTCVLVKEGPDKLQADDSSLNWTQIVTHDRASNPAPPNGIDWLPFRSTTCPRWGSAPRWSARRFTASWASSSPATTFSSLASRFSATTGLTRWSPDTERRYCQLPALPTHPNWHWNLALWRMTALNRIRGAWILLKSHCNHLPHSKR